MKITVHQGGIQMVAAEAIVVNLFQGVAEPGGATGVVDRALDGAISELIAAGDLRGKLGETVTLYPRGAIPARRVIIVGLGEADRFDLEAGREAAGAAAKQAQALGLSDLATIIHGGGAGGVDIAAAAQAVVEGSLLALYNYEASHRRKKDKPPQIESLMLVEFDQAKIEAIESGARAGQIIAESVYLARTLVNQPPNMMTPTHLAQAARTMCTETGLQSQVLNEAAMRDLGMGALLAVSQGATGPAQFIIMTHTPPAGVNPAAQNPLVLIGKGVTFDTGGYWLKTKQGMLGMKGDMAGAAAVIGAMRAVALLKLPLPVVGLVPSVENMVSAAAYRPNDVFVAKNGISIEIISTDAEGRLILADALCYADSLAPAAVIDVATLTGGKVAALGRRTSGLFCNNDDLAAALLNVGQEVGEPLWRLPLDPAYDRQLESEVADLKNSGGRAASAVTAARFLAHFTGVWPWAHIDMAGQDSYNNGPEQTPRSYMTPGGAGLPLRTLVAFLQQRAAEKPLVTIQK